MEKIIHLLINNWIKGVDTYTHNGSTWLIFTDSKRWVIELTEDKTLWYNYNFFKQIFNLTSLDVVENQSHITKWVEDNIINKVEHTSQSLPRKCSSVEDIIQNGVKNTKLAHMKTCWSVEDTIENGVKETKSDDFNVSQFLCEEVIDKGVKETKISPTHTEYGDWLDGDEKLDEIIKNGVKETLRASYLNVDNVIQDGVKETKYNQSHQEPKFKEVLKNGVKTTSALDPSFSVRFIDGDENNDWEKVPNINEVIDNGVKETHREICEYKHTVEHIIQTGVKETKLFDDDDWVNTNRIVDEVIDNGDKVSGTFVGGKRQKEDVESVIGYGKQI
jgi:hypothetical protein